MLYKNLLLSPFVIFNSLHTSVHGVNYTLSNGRNECPGSSTDTCHIYCSGASTYSCEDVGQCYFHCDEEKGYMSGASVYGANAQHLYVDVSVKECMNGGTVHAPSNGNATFTMSEQKGFKGMTIESGDNTQNIIVDCFASAEGKDDCKDMSIYARTANYLEISVANTFEFESSKVYCPVDSTYNGPKDAPCVLNVWYYGVVKDVTVVAAQGTPRDFVVVAGSTAEISTDDPLTLQCDDGYDEYPFSKTSACWNTLSPTTDPTTNKPTIQPTKTTLKPTNTPTHKPSMNPTTINPTVGPTKTPTKSPTQHPVTANPTLNPSGNPTKSPTTDHPTISAHDKPIIVTHSPINEGQIVTIQHTKFNQATKAKHERSDDKSFWNKEVGISIEIILISTAVLLAICCICLFLCYWYRKETFYKELLYAQERSEHLGKPLMHKATDSNDPLPIQMFDQIDNNNLLVPNPQQNIREYSINSDDSNINSVWGTASAQEAQVCKTTLTSIKNNRGESISLQDAHSIGESMDLQDFDVVNDVNKTHGNKADIDTLMRVGSEIEGVQRNEVETEISVSAPGVVDLQIYDEDDEEDLALSKTDTKGFIE